MIVNKASLDAITKSFQVIFGDALKDAPTRLDDIATTVASSGPDQTYPIGALLATMREWFGDRIVQDIAVYLKTLANRDFEGTIGVNRNDIDDDQLGVYMPAIQTLAQKAAIYPYELVIEALDTNGWSTSHLGFDAKPMFSATHAWPAGYTTSQDNTTDEVLDAAAVKTGIGNMRAFKGPDGKVLDVNPTHFVCSTSLQFTAEVLFIPNKQKDSEDHTLVGTIKPENIIVESRLAAGHWFLLDCSKPIKPVIYQRRKDTEFVSQTDPTNSESVFLRKKFLYGVDFRGAAAALAWWLAYGSDGSGS